MYEKEPKTQPATFLWRVILVLIVIFIALGLALDGDAQITKERRDDPVREIIPDEIRVSFSTLSPVVDYERRLRLHYEIESSTWQKLQQRDIQLWLEVWVPVDMIYQLYVYRRVRTLWHVGQRQGTFVFPDWIRPEALDLLDFCPLAAVPHEVDPEEWGDWDDDRGEGWTCISSTTIRAENKGPVQVNVGESFRLEREDYPLAFYQLYWWAPTGVFVVPDRGAPVVWRELTFPAGRSP